VPRSRLLLAFALSVLAAGAAAVPAQAVDVPSGHTLYETGPTGRYIIDGDWQFRLDKSATWTRVQVPYSWNVTDYTNAGFIGTVGWYRKDFKLPSSAAANTWIVRFESVNYRARIWLNGKEIGEHAGAYLPFELRLPASALHRTGTNRLVVRVDNRRTTEDLPPMGFSEKNEPTGGWWNYGGLLREVYLRRVRDADIETVQLLPNLPCRTCDATVSVRATVRNYDRAARTVNLAGTYGTIPFAAGTRTIGPSSAYTFKAQVPVPKPELWSPNSPHLYDVKLNATLGGAVVQTWETHSGIRSIKNVNGHLYLNGAPLNWRGFGLHEDSLDRGFALNSDDRKTIIDEVKELGGTFIRSHYPLHPEMYELADKEGILAWSEIPMYQVRTNALKRPAVRRFGVQMLEHNILTNGTHPSIIVWSIANELNSHVSRPQAKYIAAAAAAAHRLDPTRPVGQAVAAYSQLPCQRAYDPLDVIGMNEYYSWYPGPDGSMADPTLLSGYLDKMRRCYPKQALAVTEFGAEANRDGPAEERGTFQFQQGFVKWQLDQLDKKTFLSGATYWALREFRVRPTWDGGNPRPEPPFHQKGLLTMTGEKKPAWFDVQRIYSSTTQFPLP
jgi:beta-glucuronidase